MTFAKCIEPYSDKLCWTDLELVELQICMKASRSFTEIEYII